MGSSTAMVYHNAAMPICMARITELMPWYMGLDSSGGQYMGMGSLWYDRMIELRKADLRAKCRWPLKPKDIGVDGDVAYGDEYMEQMEDVIAARDKEYEQQRLEAKAVFEAPTPGTYFKQDGPVPRVFAPGSLPAYYETRYVRIMELLPKLDVELGKRIGISEAEKALENEIKAMLAEIRLIHEGDCAFQERLDKSQADWQTYFDTDFSLRHPDKAEEGLRGNSAGYADAIVRSEYLRERIEHLKLWYFGYDTSERWSIVMGSEWADCEVAEARAKLLHEGRLPLKPSDISDSIEEGGDPLDELRSFLSE